MQRFSLFFCHLQDFALSPAFVDCKPFISSSCCLLSVYIVTSYRLFFLLIPLVPYRNAFCFFASFYFKSFILCFYFFIPTSNHLSRKSHFICIQHTLQPQAWCRQASPGLCAICLKNPSVSDFFYYYPYAA